jgi:concanavalin A-like lectin/glucanase superfamily protein
MKIRVSLALLVSLALGTSVAAQSPAAPQGKQQVGPDAIVCTIYWTYGDCPNPIGGSMPNDVWRESTGVGRREKLFILWAGRPDYPTTILADSPVAYWRGEETSGTQASDSSGNAKHGTYQGNPSLGQSGVILDGLVPSLDGTDDGAHVPPALTISATNPFTIEAWVQTTDTDGPVIAHRNNSEARGLLSLHIGYNGCNFPSNAGTGKPSLFIRNLGDSTDCRHIMTSPVAVNDGQPHHIVATRDSSRQWKLYVDSVERGSMTDTVSDAGALDLSAIGIERKWIQVGYSTPARRYLAGKIDEVAIYAMALSLARVQAHYQAGSPPSPDQPPAALSDASVANTYCLPGIARWEMENVRASDGVVINRKVSAFGACGAKFQKLMSTAGVYAYSRCRVVTLDGIGYTPQAACGSYWY